MIYMSKERSCEKITKMLIDIYKMAKSFGVNKFFSSDRLKEALRMRREIIATSDEVADVMCESVMPKKIEIIELNISDLSGDVLLQDLKKKGISLPWKLHGYIEVEFGRKTGSYLGEIPEKIELVRLHLDDLTDYRALSYEDVYRLGIDIGLEPPADEITAYLALNRSKAEQSYDYVMTRPYSSEKTLYSIGITKEGITEVCPNDSVWTNIGAAQSCIFKMPEGKMQRYYVAARLRKIMLANRKNTKS
jgi:hypothetical protein